MLNPIAIGSKHFIVVFSKTASIPIAIEPDNTFGFLEIP